MNRRQLLAKPTSMDPTARTDWRIERLVVACALVTTGISQSIIFVVLPSLGRSMGYSDLEISSVVSTSSLAFVVCAPWLGGLSERIGRVLFMRIGLMAAVLANFAFGATVSAELGGYISSGMSLGLLVTSRVMLSVCWGGLFPAAQAYIADTTAPQQRTAGIALISSAFGLGHMLGPVIGAGFGVFSPIAPFYGTAALTAATLAALWILVGEPAHDCSRREHKSVEIEPNRPTAWKLWPYVLMGFLIVLCSTLLQQLTGFRFQDEFVLSGEEATQRAGLGLFVLMAAYLIAQLGVLRWGARQPPLQLVRVGSVLACLGMAGFGFAGAVDPNFSFEMHVLSLGLFGLGLGLLLPGNATAITFKAHHLGQGRAAGLLSASQGIGVVTGPVVGTSIYYWNHTLPFLVASCLLMAVCFITVIANRVEGFQSTEGVESNLSAQENGESPAPEQIP